MQIRLWLPWKLYLNLCSWRGLRSNLTVVINLIPLGLWQLKVEFENSLINFKILFIKAENVSKFLIFSSLLFYSMTVDRENKFLKKLYLPLKRGMLLLVLILHALLMLVSILKRYSGDWPLNILKSTIVFYGVILSLVLDKVFL